MDDLLGVEVLLPEDERAPPLCCLGFIASADESLRRCASEGPTPSNCDFLLAAAEVVDAGGLDAAGLEGATGFLRGAGACLLYTSPSPRD